MPRSKEQGWELEGGEMSLTDSLAAAFGKNDHKNFLMDQIENSLPEGFEGYVVFKESDYDYSHTGDSHFKSAEIIETGGDDQMFSIDTEADGRSIAGVKGKGAGRPSTINAVNRNGEITSVKVVYKADGRGGLDVGPSRSVPADARFDRAYRDQIGATEWA